METKAYFNSQDGIVNTSITSIFLLRNNIQACDLFILMNLSVQQKWLITQFVDPWHLIIPPTRMMLLEAKTPIIRKKTSICATLTQIDNLQQNLQVTTRQLEERKDNWRRRRSNKVCGPIMDNSTPQRTFDHWSASGIVSSCSI